MTRQPPSDRRLEAHHARRSGIAAEFVHHGAGQPRRIAGPTFQFDEDWNAARHQVEQFPEQGNMLPGIEQALPGQRFGGRGLHSQPRRAQAAKVMIVKDDDFGVRRQANIALDSGAGVNRGAEGRQAVFGNPRPVEPAVREPLSAGIERIRI